MAKIKKLLKAFIPPIVFSVITRFIIPSKTNEIWTGNYNTWVQAQSLCTGYDNLFILEKCKNALIKVRNLEASYERDSVLFPEIQYSWGLLVGLQRAALENAGNLSVLDFGGSLGSSYYQNKEFTSSFKELKWCIVEQKQFVDCGKEYFENEQLKFYYTIEECIINFKPNILILSSVLQYLENPHQTIEKFVSLGITYIIIDRTAIIEDECDILTIQNVPEEIYKASYPAWFFNESTLLRHFNNYSILCKFESFCDKNQILNSTHKVKWNGYLLKINK